MSEQPRFIKSVENPRAVVENNDNSASDSVATSNSMDVGDQFYGELNYAGDLDWIAIDLTAGQSVQISLEGYGVGALSDSVLYLLNDTGNTVGFNDDNGFSSDSLIEYTVFTTGTYYIVADSYNGAYSGDYVVEVQEYTPPTPAAFDVLDTIDWGTSISTNSIDVYFAPSGYTYYDFDFGTITAEAWNAYERAQFVEAFDRIEAVTNLTFNIVNSASSAELVLLNDRNQIGGDALGFFNPPGEPSAGTGVFAGDQWDRSSGGDLEVGGYGFVTIVHELLHGLGLAHPHDNGGSSTVLEGVSSPFGDFGAYYLNQGVYTTMSYNSGFNSGPTGTFGDTNGDWGYEAGPMALDIAVLQAAYGANTTTAAGNTTYTLADSNVSGTYWAAIWDVSGTDEIKYSGSKNVTIDLRAATLEDEVGGGGFVSAADGIAGGYLIANGVVIENASSGSGDDTLIGNDNDNVILGWAGEDVIVGGRGNDELNGGRGRDEVNGDRGNDTLYGGGSKDTLKGGQGNDVVYGEEGKDVIRGQQNGDTLDGGSGNDNIKGGSGKDYIVGGTGNDYLAGGNSQDEIFGEAGNDKLFGNSGGDTLDGGAGDDTLKGGGGQDTFVFDVGHDADVITDFELLEDTLLISSALAGGLTAQEIVDAGTPMGVDLLLDFGSGDTILLQGSFDVSTLADQISIVA